MQMTVRRVWSGGCVGAPAQILAQWEPFIDLGVDCFMLDRGGFSHVTMVETLIAEVLPSLNSTTKGARPLTPTRSGERLGSSSHKRGS